MDNHCWHCGFKALRVAGPHICESFRGGPWVSLRFAFIFVLIAFITRNVVQHMLLLTVLISIHHPGDDSTLGPSWTFHISLLAA